MTTQTITIYQPDDGFALANSTTILNGLPVPNLDHLNNTNRARAQLITSNKGIKRTADLDNVQLILEMERDPELLEKTNGWRGLFELCGYADEEISQLWEIANILARALGVEALRTSRVRERRQMYEIALLAERWSENRNVPMLEAGRDAIEHADRKSVV